MHPCASAEVDIEESLTIKEKQMIRSERNLLKLRRKDGKRMWFETVFCLLCSVALKINLPMFCIDN